MKIRSSSAAAKEDVIEILFVMLPNTLALDWAGPAEAFRLANQSLMRMKKPAQFRLRFVGPMAETKSSVGLAWAGIEPLPTKLGARAWLVLMGYPDEVRDRNLRAKNTVTRWLRSMANELRPPHRLMTICAGALLAAEAGLLAHARVTTHHLELDALKQIEPLCDVEANRIFVVDETHGVYSSAGITTGIDLAVHLIADVCGEAIAAHVAQVMVMPLRRGPGDPEISVFLSSRAHMHPALHRVQDAVQSAPTQDWSAERMAQVACTSTRHLSRLFEEHTGMSPLQFVRGIRVELAAKALQAGKSVAQAVEISGFSSDLQLRRAWVAEGKAGLPSQAKA